MLTSFYEGGTWSAPESIEDDVGESSIFGFAYGKAMITIDNNGDASAIVQLFDGVDFDTFVNTYE